jgi:hypothetical protein
MGIGASSVDCAYTGSVTRTIPRTAIITRNLSIVPSRIDSVHRSRNSDNYRTFENDGVFREEVEAFRMKEGQDMSVLKKWRLCHFDPTPLPT